MERCDERLQRTALRGVRLTLLEDVGHLPAPDREGRGRPRRIGSRSTASSTARQKSNTAVMARRSRCGQHQE